MEIIVFETLEADQGTRSPHELATRNAPGRGGCFSGQGRACADNQDVKRDSRKCWRVSLSLTDRVIICCRAGLLAEGST